MVWKLLCLGVFGWFDWIAALLPFKLPYLACIVCLLVFTNTPTCWQQYHRRRHSKPTCIPCGCPSYTSVALHLLLYLLWSVVNYTSGGNYPLHTATDEQQRIQQGSHYCKFTEVLPPNYCVRQHEWSLINCYSCTSTAVSAQKPPINSRY